jgi:hypothetical protein
MEPPLETGCVDGKDSAESKSEKGKSSGASFIGKFKFKLRTAVSKTDEDSPTASISALSIKGAEKVR